MPGRGRSSVLALALVPAVMLGACRDPAGSDAGQDGTADGSTTADAATGDATVAPDGTGTTTDVVDPGEPQLLLHLGPDLPAAVRDRFVEHVEAVATLPVVLVPADEELAALHPDSWVLAVGDTPSTRALVPEGEVDALASEGFVLRSGTVAGAAALATDGRPLDPDPFLHTELGVSYGAYAMLEALGFAFLHPLAPTRPGALPSELPTLDETTAPRWPIRGLQLHTMHPLELNDLLQGWGPGGPDDAEGWAAMLPEWDAFLEWTLANQQNRVHWVLLAAESWQEFADGPERIDRLTQLVDRSHDFGVWVGIDAPIVQHQQHTWRLIRETGELEDELVQLQGNVDWLMQAGFDYLTTSSGTTEFTSPDDLRMLAWMDALAAHVDEAHDGRQAFIKIHASSGQEVENFVDPETGEPLNFNFLPHYADPRLGIMPHTVQHYGLTDPAPTYGNTDFEFIREFLHDEAGSRTTVWHAETAYWVSFDVDVPLFLPIYADRRLQDLRLLARDEEQGLLGQGDAAGAHMDGQLTFSSGWEWGYWLQEVVTARAAWDPRLDVEDDEEALRVALGPVVAPFGAVAEPVREILVEYVRAEQELLIEGRIGGVPPQDIVRRNGQAYLQGFETFDDISELAEQIPGLSFTMTQPGRLGLVEMRNPLHPPPGYSEEVEPLLAEMEERFGALAIDLLALQPQVPAHARPLYDDIVDAARMTALRATQVHGLYDYVDGYWDAPEPWRLMRLAAAQDALDQAMEVVAGREGQYRVDPDRIAGWRDNPTAYEFGYLWTVRTLFYWWRDEGKAIEIPINPCYLNIIDPVDVGLGEGTLTSATDLLDTVFADVPGLGSVTECLNAPASEPPMPPPGLGH